MKAKIGIEESNPASPITNLMNRIEMPRVQANERTTLASNRSGATRACSRIARITAITSRASGTISSRSCWFALSMS